MSDRIHDWLDGELPLEALDAPERERARRLREILDLGAAEEAARGRSPGLADGVMTRIAALPAPSRRRARARAFAPAVGRFPARLGLRPAATLAAACLAVGFGLGVWASRDGAGAGPAAEPSAAEGAAPAVFVRFDLRLEGARSVHLAGSFSAWEPVYEMTPSEAGTWTVTIPLQPGVHDYVYVVDGERQVLDPTAPRIADGFGSYNNRIALLASAL